MRYYLYMTMGLMQYALMQAQVPSSTWMAQQGVVTPRGPPAALGEGSPQGTPLTMPRVGSEAVTSPADSHEDYFHERAGSQVWPSYTSQRRQPIILRPYILLMCEPVQHVRRLDDSQSRERACDACNCIGGTTAMSQQGASAPMRPSMCCPFSLLQAWLRHLQGACIPRTVFARGAPIHRTTVFAVLQTCPGLTISSGLKHPSIFLCLAGGRGQGRKG